MGPPVENGRQVLETLWLDSLSLVLLSLDPLSLDKYLCICASVNLCICVLFYI